MLASFVALLRPRVHVDDAFPATRLRVDASPRSGGKSVGCAIRGEQLINLRSTCARVPRIGAYPFHRDNAAKIEQQPAAIRAGPKEEIRCRLILLGGNLAIVQQGQLAAVW